jgi:rhodanese-related sulfurtransferase
VRLVPLFPFNLVNYAFGVTGIGLGEYAIASFVCMSPGAVAYTYLGYAGLEAASGRAGVIHKALFALALLAVVAFLPRLVRRLRGQRYADAASLKRRLESGENVALVDVRTAEEFRGPLGHIAGATNIPITEISRRLRELTEVKGPIITIWRTERRSSSAAATLSKAGLEQVFVLSGGMENWNKAGYPAERGWALESGIVIGAQVSVYPLRQEHLNPAVQAVKTELATHGLKPEIGTMSTQVVGEPEAVFAALTQSLR